MKRAPSELEIKVLAWLVREDLKDFEKQKNPFLKTCIMKEVRKKYARMSLLTGGGK